MRDRRDAAVVLEQILAAGAVLVVSGAGISTDSGIPDYRGPGGRLRHALPMTFERFVSSSAERQRYWARSHLGWERVAAARPNTSHLAVAALQRAGLVTAVVTQNVDGLHTVAGSDGVIDLHGRLDTVVCLGCQERRPRLEVALRLDVVNPRFREHVTALPGVVRPDGDVVLSDAAVRGFRPVDCRSCGGALKPDVVFFGEHVPRGRFEAAFAALDRSAALLVLGSSLMVGSGYRFVTAAVRRGLPVVIVNRGVTRGDRHADIKIDAPLLEVFVPTALDVTARHLGVRQAAATSALAPSAAGSVVGSPTAAAKVCEGVPATGDPDPRGSVWGTEPVGGSWSSS